MNEGSKRIRKAVVGCVEDVVAKNDLLFQLWCGNKKEMSSCLRVFFMFERVG